MPIERLDPDPSDAHEVMLARTGRAPVSIGFWPGPHETGSSIQHTTSVGTTTFYWQRLDPDEEGHAVHLYVEG